MNDSRELKRRLMKYLIPVVALSIAMNVTKFLEIELVFNEFVVDTVDGYNITEWRWVNKAEIRALACGFEVRMRDGDNERSGTQ